MTYFGAELQRSKITKNHSTETQIRDILWENGLEIPFRFKK